MSKGLRDQDELRLAMQAALQEDISQVSILGSGAVNTAYRVDTRSGNRYVVKVERGDKEFQPQNSLAVEADVMKRLGALGLSVPIPRVAFVSENPTMYGYEYVDGAVMKEAWASLSEAERVHICEALGRFHAEIGKKFTRDMAEAAGVKIDRSADIHPEIAEEYGSILADADVPEAFKELAREARAIFDATAEKAVFQFLHNDAHHENVLIKEGRITGIIDFGNAEHGEVTKEFSRYIRDFPEHFQHIVSAYEAWSGNALSYRHLVSNALLSGLMEIVEEHRKGEAGRAAAERSIAVYTTLLTKGDPAVY